MDQIKIGNFIAQCRKKQKLTQSQLAEKLNITDRAVSKWETGRALPDSSIMLELCDILEITVNDLLSGEVVTMNNYDKMNEKILLEMVKHKEESDKKMLALEYVIGFLSAIIIIGFSFIAAYIQMEEWVKVVLIVSGFVIGLTGFFIALRIEQVAGYYECAKCKERYIPSYKAVSLAMHFGRTRYLKCPKCGKRSWNKKVISK